MDRDKMICFFQLQVAQLVWHFFVEHKLFLSKLKCRLNYMKLCKTTSNIKIAENVTAGKVTPKLQPDDIECHRIWMKQSFFNVNLQTVVRVNISFVRRQKYSNICLEFKALQELLTINSLNRTDDGDILCFHRPETQETSAGGFTSALEWLHLMASVRFYRNDVISLPQNFMRIQE